MISKKTATPLIISTTGCRTDSRKVFRAMVEAGQTSGDFDSTPPRPFGCDPRKVWAVWDRIPHVARTATPPHHATGSLHVSTSSPGRRLWPFGPSIGWRGCSSFWSWGGRRLGSIGLGLDLAGGGGLGGVVAVVPTAQVGAFGSARTRRHRRWRIGLDRR